MSETYPGSHGALGAAAPEEISSAARLVKTDDAHLIAAREQMNQSHPMLLRLLGADYNALVEADFQEAMWYMKGILSAYQLLRGVAEAHQGALPVEMSAEKTSGVHGAELNYGMDERALAEDYTIDPFERLKRSNYDVFSSFSRFRDLEQTHPNYAPQGVRLAARSVMRPVHYFEEFVSTGFLGEDAVDVLRGDPSKETRVMREHKLFFEFLNGYTNTIGNILLLEEKSAFMQRFGDA